MSEVAVQVFPPRPISGWNRVGGHDGVLEASRQGSSFGMLEIGNCDSSDRECRWCAYSSTLRSCQQVLE